MRVRSNVITLSVLAALGMWGNGAMQAAEIVILANQGAVSAVCELAPAFEKASGHKVVVSFELGPAMNKKINSNAPADLVSQILDQFDDLIKRGKVVPGAYVEYARAGNGLAVKAGAPKPDISTPEAFKQAMLNAKSIGHSNAGTGPFNTKLFGRVSVPGRPCGGRWLVERDLARRE
jgi:molybdate transport system substrate-binding protein